MRGASPVPPQCMCKPIPRAHPLSRQSLLLLQYRHCHDQVRKPQQTKCFAARKLPDHTSSRRKTVTKLQAVPSAGEGGSLGDVEPSDANELTTALNNAIAAEDYQLAATLRDRLRQLSGGDAGPLADWQNLGIPSWLAERAEHIGYRFPTGATLTSHFWHDFCLRRYLACMSAMHALLSQNIAFLAHTERFLVPLQRCRGGLQRSSAEARTPSFSPRQALAKRWHSSSRCWHN